MAVRRRRKGKNRMKKILLVASSRRRKELDADAKVPSQHTHWQTDRKIGRCVARKSEVFCGSLETAKKIPRPNEPVAMFSEVFCGSRETAKKIPHPTEPCFQKYSVDRKRPLRKYPVQPSSGKTIFRSRSPGALRKSRVRTVICHLILTRTREKVVVVE